MKKSNDTELEHLYEVYDFNHSYLKCFGISELLARGFLANLVQFADQKTEGGPDLYSRYDRVTIGIEHFEYDVSRKNKNGSTERRGLERANREFLIEARRAAIDGRELSGEYKTTSNSSVATLKANFLDNFRKHKDKINIYKRNLREKFEIRDPYIWFLAEDRSIMGPMFNNGLIINGYPEFPLLPIFYKDVYDEVLSSGIDGIILLSSFPISNHVTFIRNTENNYSDLAKYYHFNESLPIQLFNDMPYGFYSFCNSD